MYISFLGYVKESTPIDLIVDISSNYDKISLTVIISITSVIGMSYYVYYSIREKMRLIKEVQHLNDNLTDVRKEFTTFKVDVGNMFGSIWNAINTSHENHYKNEDKLTTIIKLLEKKK